MREWDALTEQDPLAQITLSSSIGPFHEPRLQLMTELLDHGVHMWFQWPDAIEAVVLRDWPLLCRMLLVIGLAEEVVYDVLFDDNGTRMVVLSKVSLGVGTAEHERAGGLTSVFFQSPLMLYTVLMISGVSASKTLGAMRTTGPYRAWRRCRTRWKLPLEM